MAVHPNDAEILVACTSFAEYRAAGGWRTTASGFRSARQRLLETARASEGDALPPVEPVGSTADWYNAIKARTQTLIEQRETIPTITVAPNSDNWVGVVFLGDIHIGGLIDYDRLEADLDLIESTEGLYIVGMGDYCEMFAAQPKLHRAMAENAVPAADEQLELAQLVLGRTQKWIALLLGNHDAWAGPTGVQRLADRLDAGYVSEAGASLKIEVGKQRYVGYVKHQWKGHSNINTSNESRRFWQEFPEWENADFTVLAHYHQPDTHIKEIKRQSVSHLRSGTYKLHDDYASKGGYVPAYGPSLVLLSPNEHLCLPWHGPHWQWGVKFLNLLRSEHDAVL